MSGRDAKRCRDRAEELRRTSEEMTSAECQRIRLELADEYEVLAEKAEISDVERGLRLRT